MNEDQKTQLRKVSASQLSSEAHFALGFVCAEAFYTSKQRSDALKEIRRVNPMRAAGILSWARSFRNAFALTFKTDFKDRATVRSKWFPVFEKGLAELMAFGIVEGKRDGHREWVITAIHDPLCPHCGHEGGMLEGGSIFMN